jgi:excisionase family DNA binding protein
MAKSKEALTSKLMVMKMGRVEKSIADVPQQELSDLMTVQAAAKHFGITAWSVYELIERGRLEKVEFLGRVLLRRSEVLAFERQKAGRKPKVASATKSAG